MKSVEELTEMHKRLWLACYNYAAGKLNAEIFRTSLEMFATEALTAQLSADEYDFEVECDANNNPIELRAKGGFHVDVTITEKVGLKRTFHMPIDAPPPLIMSLTESPQDHS